MKKRIAIILSLLLTFILVLSAPVVIYAHHRAKVLGESTSLPELSIQPTVEGPGLLLPDSPFFFLDQVKQSARTFLAFTPEAKAKVHTSVAGERMAELRFMLARNNRKGMEIALQGISDSFQAAAEDVAQAQLSGRNVSVLAKTINDDIKLKQKSLDSLEAKATGQVRKQVEAVSEALVEAKVQVEESLPEADIQNEIQYDLSRKASKEVREATNLAKELKGDLDELNKQVSEAASRSLNRRQDVLHKAIKDKNEALKKTQEKLVQAEKEKQEKLLKVQKEAMEQAAETIKQAQKAAASFQKAQASVDEIKKQPVTVSDSVKKPTPTPTPYKP